MENEGKIRLGAGAGYSGDRIDPAVDLAAYGALDYLIFECLAERTIALAQQQKMKDPDAGYDPLLESRFRACLPVCKRNGVKIITNMGAANPIAAMHKTAQLAREMGLTNLKVAAVTGDDVLDQLLNQDLTLMESGNSLSSLEGKIVSANAYLGAQPIVDALQNGADVILTGRVADPALYVAPMVYEFGWRMDDYPKLGKATLLGHLMECAGQITGGYFADPGYKQIDNLEDLGFPIAIVDNQGNFVISKLAESGGQVTTATCKEQLLYEIHDPSAYFTPDVVADFSKVSFREVEKNKIEAMGATGKNKSRLLKVSVGYRDSYIGEGQISYAGPGARARAELARNIIEKRLPKIGVNVLEHRFDLMGINAITPNSSERYQDLPEVRLRVAIRTASMKEAIKVGNEVEALYTNGPAGGGGVFKHAREVIAIQSVLIPESLVNTKNYYLEIK